MHFQAGNSYAITGSSGVGKSTLLLIAAGLDEPTRGKVFFNTLSIEKLSAFKKDQITNSSLGFVFQQPYLIQELSALENVMLKGLIAGHTHKKCQQMATNLLEQVGLQGKLLNFPAELSGGQQQRVALARALLNRPQFLFADEPTGNLDETTSKQVIDLLIACQKSWSMGLIVSTHDSQIAERMSVIFEIKQGNVYKK